MVCAGFTSERDEAEITELSPLCVEGRVIYAATFDPALERPPLGAAPDGPAPETESALVAPPSDSPLTPPAGSPDKRLFLIGVAAGVIAALAFGAHGSQS